MIRYFVALLLATISPAMAAEMTPEQQAFDAAEISQVERVARATGASVMTDPTIRQLAPESYLPHVCYSYGTYSQHSTCCHSKDIATVRKCFPK